MTTTVLPRREQTALFLALLLLFALLPLFVPGLPRAWILPAAAAVVIGLMVVIGWTIMGRWDGILIDTGGMSLARLQLVLWTIVFLSAWPAAVFMNIAAGVSDPLAVSVPQELWVLLGISTTALVGSPVLQSARPKAQLRDFVREQEQPSWKDLFLGEEEKNKNKVDVANVQMFFFTFVIVFSYAIALTKMFADATGAITAFPAVEESTVALLGISAAGFLANKSIEKR